MPNTNSYTFVKQNCGRFFKDFLHNVSLRAHAEEEPPATPPNDPAAPAPASSAPPAPLDIEALLARVRKEEKDKLYGKIQKLEKENAEYKSRIESYILQIGSYQQEVEKLRDNPAETKKLTDKIAQLEHDLEEAKKSTVDEATIRAQVEAEFEVKSYAKDQIAANKDSILTSFVGEVTGKTKEEIDASLAKVIEKTTQIKKDLGLLDDKGNPVTVTKKKPTNNPAPTKPPIAAPASTEEDSFDPEYVRNLDPRSPEYAEFRKKYGLR